MGFDKNLIGGEVWRVQETGVVIRIKAIAQDAQGEQDVVEYATVGTLSCQNGGFTLRYDEGGVSDLTGKSTILVGEDTVVLSREGEMSMRMMLKEGYKYLGSYSTPFGDLKLEALPTLVSSSLGAQGEGSVQLSYHMTIQDQYVGLNQLQVQFQRQGAQP